MNEEDDWRSKSFAFSTSSSVLCSSHLEGRTTALLITWSRLGIPTQFRPRHSLRCELLQAVQRVSKARTGRAMSVTLSRNLALSPSGAVLHPNGQSHIYLNVSSGEFVVSQTIPIHGSNVDASLNVLRAAARLLAPNSVERAAEGSN